MLAGHGFGAFELAHHFGAASQSSSSFAPDSLFAEAFGRASRYFSFGAEHAHGRSALGVTLSDDSGLTAVVAYSTHSKDGVSESELKVTVSGAAADSSLDVSVGDTVVGTIVTDAEGAGSLTLSSNPDTDEQQLPADLAIAAGTTVSVGSLSGTLAATTPLGGCGGPGGGFEDGTTTTRLRGNLTDPDNSASSAIVGLKVKTDDTTGESTTTLGVRVRGAAASTTLDVTVGDVVVGQVTTDENGDAKVVFSSNPTGDQVAFTNVPTDVAAGTTVTVGSLTGTLDAPTEHFHRFRRR
jgi:hypothetical protein